MDTSRSELIAALPLTVPAVLPIAEQADTIVAALAATQVLVVAGETGSGKTTQLPKLCLRAGLGTKGLIGHTQPRRLAARTVASRLAQELEVNLGEQVGYSVRFADRTSTQTLIKLMTDGLLLAEIQSDRDLSRYEVLIIDEAHERSLNIDFLLGYLKGLLQRRPEFKLIITSATIDTQAFADHFQAPVVEVSGRGYPVTVEYLAPSESAEPALVEQVLDCVARMEQAGSSGAGRDALVFLSGEREIFALARDLRSRLSERWEVLPLYARLPTKEQQRVFAPGTLRRLVLCTNVAETSLTVPNIGYVIDAGLARISRYSYRSKLQRLPIEAISKASANQRMGRCGRIAPGTCFRLYDEADFQGRPDYTDPEIKRTNLASVVLQMQAFRLGDIHRFPFLEPPEAGAVRAAIKLLEELQAFAQGRATALGRQMARLPVDPRLARMILEAAKRGALREVLIIVSALSVQDPRERPPGQRGQADARHETFAHERSDFLSWLSLWEWSEKERESLTRRRYERLLKTRFLSVPRMREWREVHRQLRLATQSLRLRANQVPAEYSAIHQALLSGSLGFVGRHDERGVFEGVQNLRFRIFPGSALFESRPKWLMAAEIAETQRVYARCVAHIEPRWVEEQASHLLKRQYSEPHFSAKRGEAMAYERVSFRGLPLVEKRRVSYTAIDPELARGLLISEGLVIGALAKKAPFLDANLARVRELQQQEAKLRRRDLLISAEEQAAWYHERLPVEVVCQRSLQSWLKRRPENDGLLRWSNDDLAQTSAVGLADYPSELTVGDVQFRLRDRFARGEADDGVSIEVPLGKLSTLSPEDLSWGVPGTFEAQCEQWLKTLPKAR
ncbi:MAG: ATP-dependent RNA helicase HrpA, partial [Pseudomonadales bacterium]